MATIPLPTEAFPALITVDWEEMNLEQVEQKLVLPFVESRTRSVIFDGLCTVISTLRDAGISGDLWLDGSFVTEKQNPEDVDVLLDMNGHDYDNGSDSFRNAVDWFEQEDLKQQFCVDSYVCRRYVEESHPWHYWGETTAAYWRSWFCFYRGRRPTTKGIGIIVL